MCSLSQARRDTKDEPWAWQSREYLRKKVIGKAVVFKVDYTVPSINREFGSVFLDDTNLAIDVVANGWARVSRLCIMQVGNYVSCVVQTDLGLVDVLQWVGRGRCVEHAAHSSWAGCLQ
jgi:hypothetical protein